MRAALRLSVGVVLLVLSTCVSCSDGPVSFKKWEKLPDGQRPESTKIIVDYPELDKKEEETFVGRALVLEAGTEWLKVKTRSERRIGYIEYASTFETQATGYCVFPWKQFTGGEEESGISWALGLSKTQEDQVRTVREREAQAKASVISNRSLTGDQKNEQISNIRKNAWKEIFQIIEQEQWHRWFCWGDSLPAEGYFLPFRETPFVRKNILGMAPGWDGAEVFNIIRTARFRALIACQAVYADWRDCSPLEPGKKFWATASASTLQIVLPQSDGTKKMLKYDFLEVFP